MTHSATSSQVSNDEYYSQSDEAELKRLQDLAGSTGMGDDLTDDETSEFIDLAAEIGVDLRRKE